MRRAEVHVGREYLTRTLRVRGLFGPRTTRGHVRVVAIVGNDCRVRWLMRDGTERKDRCLPRYLKPRQLLTEVKP